MLVISGTGDVIQPTDNIAAIGSGGTYALAAARALAAHSNLNAAEIVRKALEIRRKAIEEGMITLRNSGLEKLRATETSIEEVLRESVL